MMRIVRLDRPVRFVLALTAATIVVSIVISTALQYWAGNPRDLVHFALAIGMPANLVPPTVLPLLRANERLQALKAQLDKLAHSDPLTGLPNRLAFFKRVDEIFDDGDRRSIALMMVDIDHFKGINDTYGHDAGDAVLRHVASRLVESMSGGPVADDMAARIGGDEFAILIPGIDRQQSSDLAARICDAMRERPCLHHGVPISVSVSIGIAMRVPGQNSAATFKAADLAIYEAKALGRNRFCFMRDAGMEAQSAPVPGAPARLPQRAA